MTLVRIYSSIIFLCLYVNLNAQSSIVEFSQKGGLYEKPLKLNLKSTFKLKYTLNGETPDWNSPDYTSAISINETKVLKVRAYKDSTWQEGVWTQTYLLGLNTRFSVLSISTDSNNFFHPDTGIYVIGPNKRQSKGIYYGANWTKGWERSCVAELYNSEGKQIFNQACGIRIFGGMTKQFVEKSLRIGAGEKYGKKRFKGKVFKDKKIKSFKDLVIRHSGNDYNKTRFKDALVSEWSEELGLDHQAYEPVLLFFNGQCWGVYNLREKINKQFFKSNHKANKDSLDIIQSSSHVEAGSKQSYRSLLDLMKTSNMSKDSVYKVIEAQVDIDNYIDFRILQCYLNNIDVRGNIRYWRARNLDAKWRWVVYDTDLGFGTTLRANAEFVKMSIGKGKIQWFNPPYSTFFFGKLMENPKFKIRFINRATHLLNTILKKENSLDLIQGFQNRYAPEMKQYHFPYKAHHTEMRWLGEIKRMRYFASNRPKFMLQNMQTLFNLPGMYNLDIQNMDFEKGKLYIEDLELQESYCTKVKENNRLFKGQYFKQNPLNVRYNPALGFDFSHWKKRGGRLNTASLVLKGDEDKYLLEAVLKKTKNSSLQHKLRITELALDEKKKGQKIEWIELYNTSDSSIWLKNFFIRDEYAEYSLKDSILLEGGALAILCVKKKAFFQKYQADSSVVVLDVDKYLTLKNQRGIGLYDANRLIIEEFALDFATISGDTLFQFGLTSSANDPTQIDNWAVSNGGENIGVAPFSLWGYLYKSYWIRAIAIAMGLVVLFKILSSVKLGGGRRKSRVPRKNKYKMKRKWF